MCVPLSFKIQNQLNAWPYPAHLITKQNQGRNHMSTNRKMIKKITPQNVATVVVSACYVICYSIKQYRTIISYQIHTLSHNYITQPSEITII